MTSAPAITDAMGRQAPEGLIGIHTNLLVTALGGAPQPTDTDEERAAADAEHRHSGKAASATSSSRQRGRRRSATRCWTRQSRSPPGCSTTTPTPTTRSPARSWTGKPTGNLTRDHILDNITLYWLTGTGASAARSYWESGQAQAAADCCRPGASPSAKLPVGFTQFPDEIFRAPRSWVEQGYPNLIYFNKADKGGHFAAWEQPEMFSRRDPGGLQVGALMTT